MAHIRATLGRFPRQAAITTLLILTGSVADDEITPGLKIIQSSSSHNTLSESTSLPFLHHHLLATQQRQQHRPFQMVKAQNIRYVLQ